MDSQKQIFFMKRAETLMGELELLQGQDAQIQPAQRIEQYGHPKDFIDKLHKKCSAFKSTLDSLPKIVERLE
jgi:hypothetical protein